MSSIEIQLSASVIPDDHRVWKFSPGKTYRFYRAVHEAKKAFLDIRGLDLLPGTFDSWTDDQILEVIADDRWTRELASRARGNKPQGSEGVSSQDRKRLTYLKRLLFETQKGDLIVVPADGYTKDVLIGEITDEPSDARFIDAKDGETTHSYLGRSVNWLNGVEKRFMPAVLLDKLHSQTAMFILGKSDRDEIYRWAYGDYVFDNHFVASFHVGKEKFTSEDSAVVSVWFNAMEVLQDAVNRDAVQNLPQSFAMMGLSKLPDARAAELQINVNSPGTYLFRSGGPFALALAAMFALSACSPSDIDPNKITVKLKVVGTASDGCVHHIEQTVRSLAGAMGTKETEEFCKFGERARTDAKMSAAAKLKP